MSLGGHILCISVVVFLGVELLGHRLCICAALVEIAKSFSKVVGPIYTSNSSDSVSIPVTPYPCLYMFFILCIFILAILVNV